LKIGVLGAGNIGGTLGNHFARAGHEVFFSSRHPDKLRELVTEAGNWAKAGTLEQAANFGEVIILAIPWRKKEELPSPELFKSKVVVDAMNPYTAFGRVMDLGYATSSEDVAKLLPGARLVKAFNTLFAADLRSAAFKSGAERLAMFVAGDDPEAKKTVSALIEDIGFVPIDAGTLRGGGRMMQPGSPIYGKRLTEAQASATLKTSKS
jgi:8-hydroxy-5-deazaflavin:NADPH oxidoreductase